jgi:DNA-binding transcriptional regulator/RsmH inhibitor MraZ
MANIMPEWITPPDGVGDVPCDSKWRVRLPSPYAVYFFAFEKGKETASLYAATLDGQDILLWPKPLFSLWRSRLLERRDGDRAKTRQLLAAAQFYGAETEVDRQGRFVLPRTLRDALHLASPPKSFKVFNDGIIRMVTIERFDYAKRELAPPSRATDDYAVDQFTALMGQGKVDQAGDTP